MKKQRLAPLLILLVIVFICVNPDRTSAASSVNVPLDHPIYRTLDFWAAQGLVSGNLASMRPVTRKEAGRQIADVLNPDSAID